MTVIIVATIVAKMNSNAPKHYAITTIKYSNTKTFYKKLGQKTLKIYLLIKSTDVMIIRE